ncbi:GNAT family N-acetyltransferase [Stieleria sp. TO1_6]|uniref:GNAT family N-acetyltransferase n=1 Tax=Stieleria tagensis TaxID=2956795 RepID=UPI00209B971B|nr:GNAT family N-acetyltransferase [Stieleria tagensis]MCO8121197.1 GNAT family N-acetyltransferase [Stieleria tagensis]
MTDFQLRLATAADAQAICDIYNHYVDTSTCTFQIRRDTLPERLRWLAEHDADFPATVCCVDATVVGWASISRWNTRGGWARTGEVSVYIDANWHRRGIGRALYNDLMERAKKLRFHVLLSGICSEQEPSIGIHRAFGFTEVARFREVGYKFDRWLDVIYMQLTLDGPTSKPR